MTSLELLGHQHWPQERLGGCLGRTGSGRLVHQPGKPATITSPDVPLKSDLAVAKVSYQHWIKYRAWSCSALYAISRHKVLESQNQHARCKTIYTRYGCSQHVAAKFQVPISLKGSSGKAFRIVRRRFSF